MLKLISLLLLLTSSSFASVIAMGGLDQSQTLIALSDTDGSGDASSFYQGVRGLPMLERQFMSQDQAFYLRAWPTSSEI